MRTLCHTIYMAPPTTPGGIRVREIQRLEDGDRLAPLQGGWVLQCPLRAVVTDSKLPGYEIELEVEADEGQLVARQVVVRRGAGSAPVSGSTLRQLRVAEQIAHVLKAATELYDGDAPPIRPRVDSGPGWVTTRLAGSATEQERLRRAQTGRRASDQVMQEIVAAYREAQGDLLTSHHPTKAVAERLNYSKGHVSRVLSEARKAGLLGPARPGRPGEVISEKPKKRGARK